MKTLKLVLLSFIIVSLSLFLFLRNGSDHFVAQRLQKIPREERKCLELFFRSAFAWDQFGYTLYGDKPISVTGFHAPVTKSLDIDDMFDSVFGILDPNNLRKYQGWDVWEKYQYLFPMKNYVFVKSKNFVDNEYIAILFINKKAFLKTVSQHLDDFKAVLKEEITPELLLARVLSSDDVFGDVLKNHQGLIGTVLGYGRDNALLFHRREEVISAEGKITALLKGSKFSLMTLLKNQSDEELEAIDRSLQLFDDRGILDFNPLLMMLPGFRADPTTTETRALKVKYEQEYRKIIRHYQKGDFLEITLQQMISDNPS